MQSDNTYNFESEDYTDLSILSQGASVASVCIQPTETENILALPNNLSSKPRRLIYKARLVQDD